MGVKLPFRVIKGGLYPATHEAREIMSERKYSMHDLVFADITKPRNPQFHRLAHSFGKMLADNIDDFSGVSAHNVLKRLQIEGDIGCDHIALNFPGIGPCVQRNPRSLSFAEMDDGEFREIYQSMCRHVAERYWHNMTAEQIEEMMEVMSHE